MIYHVATERFSRIATTFLRNTRRHLGNLRFSKLGRLADTLKALIDSAKYAAGARQDANGRGPR